MCLLTRYLCFTGHWLCLQTRYHSITGLWVCLQTRYLSITGLWVCFQTIYLSFTGLWVFLQTRYLLITAYEWVYRLDIFTLKVYECVYRLDISLYRFMSEFTDYIQHKDIILIHKSASESAQPVFKVSSIRITSIRIGIASKHFLISIQGHASLAFKALPNLHICMLISFF